MKTNLIITDNFYGDPDIVRQFALSQVFDVKGNYPGARTRSFLTAELKESIQTIIWNAGGEINNWFEKDGYTGSFQLTQQKTEAGSTLIISINGLVCYT
jgi:hypothetical protein